MTPTAIITGASRGLGLALADALAGRGWNLVVDAREPRALEAARGRLAAHAPAVAALPGDVADEGHRHSLVDAARSLGGLDLLVNNASTLGATPLPALATYPLAELRQAFEVNTVAPLALGQLALPLIRERRGRIVNVTSDAAVEGYAGWGGYGASKAALEQLSRVLAAEAPAVRVNWVDPGDMRTRMQQDAFPGDDVSDRPPPQASVPGFLALLDRDLPSGRYQARELAALDVAAGA
jgi:NAD(P)-dependent dehydrogenase (short-subunit alcohol dehydrogenase family)